jgi:hypothetical protein
LLQLHEHVVTGESIYKICKTKRDFPKSFERYPKGSDLILHLACSDCTKIKKDIIKLFKNKYIIRTDYGNEYFEENCNSMRIDIYDIILDDIKRSINNNR